MRPPVPRFLQTGETIPVGTIVRMLEGPWYRRRQDWLMRASPDVEIINAHDRYWRGENGYSLQPMTGMVPIDGQSEWVTGRWVDAIEVNSFVLIRSHCYRSGEWYVEKDDNGSIGLSLHTANATEGIEAGISGC